MYKKIEQGKQLGIEKRIFRDNKYYWYVCAVQKKETVYYVYECEIAEDDMAKEVFEYENIYKYLSLKDVKIFFPNKYGIYLEDIHTLKGQKIFNVDLYL